LEDLPGNLRAKVWKTFREVSEYLQPMLASSSGSTFLRKSKTFSNRFWTS
jgi:hypothetical protein